MKENRLNRVRNPSFRMGRLRPLRWTFVASEESAFWERVAETDEPNGGGVRIESRRARGRAVMEQNVPCRAGDYYRIEATARCEKMSASDVSFDSGGLVLAVTPVLAGRTIGPRRVTPGYRRVDRSIEIRTYYRAPQGARQLRVQVGLEDAPGSVVVNHVRVFTMIEPEEESHVLALPPPAHLVAPPRPARSIGFVSDTMIEGELHRRLTAIFSSDRVRMIATRDWTARTHKDIDAWLFADATPPRGLSTLSALLKLANERIVLVSIHAFAKLAGKGVTLKRIEQPDDPLHARIDFAHHGTRGFALHDGIAFASPGATIGSHVQFQFQKTDAFRRLCKRHRFHTLLSSLTNRDATSGHPIALFKETPGGGLYVLDPDPLNQPMSTFSEGVPGTHLLQALLGRAPAGLGQYTVPDRAEPRFRDLIRELELRFQPVSVEDGDLPIDDVKEQLVKIGGVDFSHGLALRVRPVILIRSGLFSGDAESIYGAFLWIKQLLRMPPHECPYAAAILSRFRIHWEPCAAPWESKEGWRRSATPADGRTTFERLGRTDEKTAALIDIVSRPIDHLRVVLGSRGPSSRRLLQWLPRVYEAFGPLSHIAARANDPLRLDENRGTEWRQSACSLRIISDADSFDSHLLRATRSAGVDVIRLEVPGRDADFAAHSIHRTAIVATTLEHIVGLLYGLVAVNRCERVVHFDGFPPVAPGEAMIEEERSAVLQAEAVHVG
jgi:hypothetical protein